MGAALDEPYLGFTFLITAAMQLTFFLIAYYFQFDKVTDLAGTANFVLLAVLVFLVQQVGNNVNGPTDRAILVTVMVGVWGLRLGAFLLNRVLVRGKDDRFDEMRSRFWAFLGFWVFQIFWQVVSLDGWMDRFEFVIIIGSGWFQFLLP